MLSETSEHFLQRPGDERRGRNRIQNVIGVHDYVSFFFLPIRLNFRGGHQGSVYKCKGGIVE